MTNNLNSKNYTYTSGQLDFFAKEIKKAEGFDELMILKKALDRKEDGYFIASYENIEEYKEKYLTGKYESLRPVFDTKVPYSFWSQLFIALKNRKVNHK